MALLKLEMDGASNRPDFKIRLVDRIGQHHNFHEKHIFYIGFGRRDLSRKLNWVGVLKIRPVIGEIHGVEALKILPIFFSFAEKDRKDFQAFYAMDFANDRSDFQHADPI